MNDCIVSRFSNQPSLFEIGFGRGIFPALGEGIAPQNAPHSAQDPRNDAEIVDTPLGIFRTGGPVQTGPVRKILLIKTDHADAQPLDPGLKHVLFQILPEKRRILRPQAFHRDRR